MEPIVNQAIDRITADLDDLMPVARTMLECAIRTEDVQAIANLYQSAYGYEDGVFDELMELVPSEDQYDDSMDGDHESGLASAGFGTDEDYGYYGSDE